MEWTSIAIPTIHEDENVPGLIIGTPEYVDKIQSYIPEDEKF